MGFTEDSQNGDVVQPKYDIYTPTTTQKYRLGARYHKADGRTFHYAKAGTTALIAGELQQSAVDCFTANEQQDINIATASAVGDDWAYATVGTDAVIKDQLLDGWFIVSDGTAAQGAGQIYQIKSHPASAAGSIKFNFYDKIKVLISVTGTSAGLIMNPYNGIVQAPTTSTGWCVGVTPVVVTASYFFWLQTWGMCACLAAGALVVAEQVVRGPAVAGACAAQDANTSEEYEIIGIAGHTTDDTDHGFVYLQIAP